MFDLRKKRKASGHVDAAIALTLLSVAVIVFLVRFVNITKKTQITSLLQKNYNIMNNVIVFSEADNGYNLYWELPKSNEFVDMEVFLSKYYLPYFDEAKLVKRENFDNLYSIFNDKNGRPSEMVSNYIVLKDNSILSFSYNKEDNYMLLFADINGISKPNKMGYDIFVYCIFNGKYHMVNFLENNNNIGDINYLMSDEIFGCNKTNTGEFRNFYCGRVIELNNWELPKDYPL